MGMCAQHLDDRLLKAQYHCFDYWQDYTRTLKSWLARVCFMQRTKQGIIWMFQPLKISSPHMTHSIRRHFSAIITVQSYWWFLSRPFVVCRFPDVSPALEKIGTLSGVSCVIFSNGTCQGGALKSLYLKDTLCWSHLDISFDDLIRYRKGLYRFFIIIIRDGARAWVRHSVP